MKRWLPVLLVWGFASCDAEPPPAALPPTETPSLPPGQRPGAPPIIAPGSYVSTDLRGEHIGKFSYLELMVEDDGSVTGRLGTGPGLGLKLLGRSSNGVIKAEARNAPRGTLVRIRATMDATLTGTIRGKVNERGVRGSFGSAEHSALSPTIIPTIAAGRYELELVGDRLTRARLLLNVSETQNVRGSAQGMRDGHGFSIPLTGRVSEGGQTLRAKGERGASSIRIMAKLENEELVGTATGAFGATAFGAQIAGPVPAPGGTSDVGTRTRPATPDVGDPEPPAAPVAAPACRAGAFRQKGMQVGGFRDVTIRLLVRDTDKVSGTIQAKSDATGLVSVPLQGNYDVAGRIVLSGNRGKASMRVEASCSEGAIDGFAAGDMGEAPLRFTFEAAQR